MVVATDKDLGRVEGKVTVTIKGRDYTAQNLTDLKLINFVLPLKSQLQSGNDVEAIATKIANATVRCQLADALVSIFPDIDPQIVRYSLAFEEDESGKRRYIPDWEMGLTATELKNIVMQLGEEMSHMAGSILQQENNRSSGFDKNQNRSRRRRR